MIKFLKKGFHKVCYLIYRNGLNYHLETTVERFINMSDIDQGAIIRPTGGITNSQKKSAIKIGNQTIISGHLMTFGHGGQITIGNHSFVGPGTRIWSAKKISIGDRVLIAHDVNIHDNISHPLDSFERHKDQLYVIEKGGFQPANNLNEKEIVIEDDVWIGFNTTILKGVTIGKGAIIGACTVITKDVPAYAVVVGNPPRIVKYTT
jgi:acetyltransferase-like isoleucine patch superfamily enzyme